MKKCFIFIYILIFLVLNINAQTFKSELPKNLKKSFDIYKNAKLNKNYLQLYKLQMPYFRYLYDFSYFKLYMKQFFSLDDFKITNVQKINDEKYILTVGYLRKNSDNMKYYNQIWYNVNNQFFTVEEDLVLFKD